MRPLGKEYIVVAEGIGQVNFNRMVSMNATAAFLWQEVEGKDFDAETLVKLLLDNCDVAREVAANDVEALIKSWTEAGIVE